MELFKASKQWSNRPADERFESLTDLYDQTKRYADESVEKDVELRDIRVENVDGEVTLVGRKSTPARLTHWAFGQLASKVGAPAGYLRELPATLAAQNLNHGLAHRMREYGEDSVARLLFHKNGSLLVRAFLSTKYQRIWNHEVAERLVGLEGQGWTGAKPTIRWDGGDISRCLMCDGKGTALDEFPLDGGAACVKCKGTGRALPALYASDHDMFAFITNRENPIKEYGTDLPLYKGAIVWNSEVGASTLGVMKFRYREVCGNHIIWGASELLEINLRHVGSIRENFELFAAKIREYADESVSDEEATIKRLKTTLIAATKSEVLDALFGVRNLGISRRTLEASYDAVVEDKDGDANTVWGFVQGVTRHSQTLPYADERVRLDRAAGKIMEVEF